MLRGCSYSRVPRIFELTARRVGVATLRSWHVFVGRKFGLFVTHEEGKFIYFYIGQVGVCIFQS